MTCVLKAWLKRSGSRTNQKQGITSMGQDLYIDLNKLLIRITCCTSDFPANQHWNHDLRAEGVATEVRVTLEPIRIQLFQVWVKILVLTFSRVISPVLCTVLVTPPLTSTGILAWVLPGTCGGQHNTGQHTHHLPLGIFPNLCYSKGFLSLVAPPRHLFHCLATAHCLSATTIRYGAS